LRQPSPGLRFKIGLSLTTLSQRARVGKLEAALTRFEVQNWFEINDPLPEGEGRWLRKSPHPVDVKVWLVVDNPLPGGEGREEVENMEAFNMIDISKIWPFIISELIPGFFLSLGLYMYIDNITNKAMRSINVSIYISLLIFIAFSIVAGFVLSNISLIIFEKITKRCVKYNLITVQTMFFNLIIPTLLIGYVFPGYIAVISLQPWFMLMSLVVAIVFLAFGLFQSWIETNIGDFLVG